MRNYGMQLKDLSQHATRGQKISAYMRARGINTRGDRLWTDEEDTVLRRLYPNYAALTAALPHRTLWALKSRCRTLGIQRKVHVWTAKDRSVFRRMYTTATKAEIFERFPYLSVGAFHSYGRLLKLRRPKSRPVSTGNYLLDALRARAHDEGFNSSDLDQFAKARGYFKHRGWRRPRGRIKYDVIVRAIHELGGKLRIDWDDE